MSVSPPHFLQIETAPVSYTHLIGEIVKFAQAEVVFDHGVAGVALQPCHGQFPAAHRAAADDLFDI